MIKKILLGLILIVVVISAVMCVTSLMNRQSQTPPDIEEANYQIGTQSRTYYAKEVVQNDNIYTLHGYWYMADGKWAYSDGTISFDEKAYGSITVNKRK